MAISQLTRWDDSGTLPGAGNAKYVAGDQPIAEYDNWFNWSAAKDLENLITFAETHATEHVTGGADVIADAIAAGNAGLMTGGDKTKLNGVEALADVTDAVNIASSIVGVGGKATPIDADSIGLIDSAAASVLKELTWANIKATLKTYFDALYSATGALFNVVEDTTPQLGGTLDANSKQIRISKGSDVASANALTLGTDGNYFDITGVTAITSINTLAAGTIVYLHFDGILILTHHATDLILPGGANITTAAGDEAIFEEYAAGNWRCINYSRADGEPVVSGMVGAGIAAEGTQVFNAALTAVNTWQNLDLSAVVGSRYAMVFLSVTVATGSGEKFDIRQNGTSRSYTCEVNDDCTLWKTVISAGDSSYLLMVTDSNGLVEIRSQNNTDVFTVNVVGWIGLS